MALRRVKKPCAAAPRWELHLCQSMQAAYAADASVTFQLCYRVNLSVQEMAILLNGSKVRGSVVATMRRQEATKRFLVSWKVLTKSRRDSACCGLPGVSGKVVNLPVSKV